MRYNIAVVGATGNVGRTVLRILAESSDFSSDTIMPLASKKSARKLLSFGDEDIEVQDLNGYDFDGVDIAFFTAGAAVSKQYVQIAAKAGSVVIDNSSCFRMDAGVPLVVPEVNSYSIRDHKSVIANPNCNVIQIVTALKPLHDYAGINRLVITTCQSVSGAGATAMNELYTQTKSSFFERKEPGPVFQKQIAFNILPHIGDFLEDGSTSEEQKISKEINKIMDSDFAITATCLRTPVFIGHGTVVNAEFENNIDAVVAEDILRRMNYLKVVSGLDEDGEVAYTTPLEVVGLPEVHVSRIRNDSSRKNTLNMWIVADNLVKGAGLNAVQIAQELKRLWQE